MARGSRVAKTVKVSAGRPHREHRSKKNRKMLSKDRRYLLNQFKRKKAKLYEPKIDEGTNE